MASDVLRATYFCVDRIAMLTRSLRHADTSCSRSGSAIALLFDLVERPATGIPEAV